MSTTITNRGFLDKSYFSRYSKDRVLDDTVDLYYEYSSYIDFSSVRYIEHVMIASEVNNLPLLADKYLKNPLYWWMIAFMNDIFDPFTTPAIGEVIRIPYKDEVVRLYNSIVI